MNADGVAFIFVTDAIFIGRTESTAGILLKVNRSRKGCPIDMGIENRQENNDFPTLLIQICIFIDLFDTDDGTVSRRYQKTVIGRRPAPGVAEKYIKYKASKTGRTAA